MKPIKIEKIAVEAKSRKLSATWTSEVPQATYIASEISEELAKILQQEIDKEIMMDLLVAQGWTKVTVDKKKTVDKDWCNICIKKKYQSFGNNWYFEDENDANFFALAWLS
jgi:hypothetical protein